MTNQTSAADIGAWVRERLGVTLQTTYSAVDLEITDLVGVAIRQNPRRAHLLVSTVLGKHIPVDPRLVHGCGMLLGLLVNQAMPVDGPGSEPAVPGSWKVAARSAIAGSPQALIDLAAEFSINTDVLVLGFAETATGLGHSVATALGARYYLHSTRREVLGITPAGTFEESHSHASTHLLSPAPPHMLSESLPLVLVDDEFSTGQTLMAVIAELHQQFPRSRYIVAALIDLRSEAALADMAAFADRLGVQIDVVSLASGQVCLPTDIIESAAALIAAGQVDAGQVDAGLVDVGQVDVGGAGAVTRVDIAWDALVPEGGRHGFQRSDQPAFEAETHRAAIQLAEVLDPYRRVLLLGTEELMYLPTLLGCQLAQDSRFEVRFQTTTRSPVLPVNSPDYPVRRRLSFIDAEGEDTVDRYLNNAHWPGDSSELNEADVIVVVVDSPADTDRLLAPRGMITTIATLGIPVVLVVIAGSDPVQISASRGAR